MAVPALLEVWERGAGQPSALRLLSLLAAALPENSIDSLADWSIGRRDDALLSVRESLFGDRLNAVATCPHCGATVELDFHTSDIRAPYADSTPFLLNLNQGLALQLRPVTTRDLLAAVSTRESLIARCMTPITSDGTALAVRDLPSTVLDDCARALAACDPQADVLLSLTCAECSFAWEAPFDIGAFLWREIDVWAARILREVHLLASAYGWTESDVLRLSPRRRHFYLNMVAG